LILKVAHSNKSATLYLVFGRGFFRGNIWVASNGNCAKSGNS
jgi:hypothetical protein